MRRRYLSYSIYHIAFSVALLMLSACNSDDAKSVADDQDKTPIEMTVGIVGDNPAATRTVVTTDSPYGQNATAFGANTSLFMVMKSDNGGGEGTKYTRTMGTAAGSTTGASSSVSFATDNVRYWEDSYSRNSKLSVYSACVPGLSTALTIGGLSAYDINTWGTEAISTTIAWPLSGAVTSQDATFLTNQDLCFSNNVSNLASQIDNSKPDNRVYFNTSTKKFTIGNMIFHHALTKVTFKIKKGSGFGTGDDIFKFKSTDKNIELKGFNTSGTLDIATGVFSPVSTGDINNLANTKDATNDAAYEYVLTCLMLPGSELTSTATDEINLEIDNNTYHVTKAQLATALSGKKLSDNSTTALTADTKMRPGVHYIFTLTIGKKGMDNFTAAVVPWEDVNSTDADAKKTLTEFTFEDRGDKQVAADDAKFDIYRALTDATDYKWETGYATNGAATKTWVDNHWTTNWYWENDQSFYHFRAAGPSVTITTDATNGDYFTISSGTNDYLWGAPFVDVDASYKFKYDDTNGFALQADGTTKQISTAIGATNSTINMLLFHVMSKINVNVQTTTDAGKVVLEDATNTDEDKRYTKVEILNFLPNGKVLMGTGAVSLINTARTLSVAMTKGTYSAESGSDPAHVTFSYFMMPQALSWTTPSTGTIGLRITTPDGNIYTVEDLSKCYATVTNSNLPNPYTTLKEGTSDKYKIDTWYPCYQYNYTVRLTKTGILNITATLLDWETVSADEETVQIK